MSRDRYSRERSREREERYNRSDERTPLSGHTNSNDPKSLMSRVFIGNLPHEKVTRDELIEMFSKYGRVSAVNVLKGFGFVQYEREEEARKAVAMENGTVLKGQTLDIKMAAEGKKKKGQPNRDEGRGSFRDRSPVRDRAPLDRGRGGGGRDFYDDPYRARAAMKDPFDPYRRDPYADPYAALAVRRDPYAVSRDPYAAALRDTFPLAQPKAAPERPPVDCEVTVLDRGQREYADGIERRLKTHGILTFVNVLPSEDLLSKAQDDISKRGIPFNIVVSPLNQQHRSITVRILHGTPQEHRNMPLEDALKLVTSNFEVYLRNLRSGVTTATPAKPASEDFTLPDGQTSYLLNLLADNRFLTLEELNTVIRYLTQRKEQLLVKQGAVVKQPDTAADEAALAQQQQELQAKILSVLGGSGAGTGGDAGANSSALQQLSGYGGTATSAGYQDLGSSALLAGGGSNNVVMASANGTAGAAYNLSTPDVQQALDNLISNSSGLLQNLGGVTSQQQQQQLAQPGMENSQAAMYQGYNYPNY